MYFSKVKKKRKNGEAYQGRKGIKMVSPLEGNTVEIKEG